MLHVTMSNSTSLSEEASASSGTRVQDLSRFNNMFSDVSPQQPQKIKKKRNLPGNPDPDSEVIALSPKTLMTTNRFICEICNKGFQRDQNLQLHRRGHNLPWKLRQRSSKEVIRKKVYVCPEPLCVHHHPSRALGDLTGIKKHFCRKHGEKKWKCEKCSKRYAVQSDYKAHSKTCGTREYKCDCGTIFSRKDSFITHRAFCDALAQESARLSNTQLSTTNPIVPADHHSLHLHHSHSNNYQTSSSPPPPNSSLFPFPNISLTDPTIQNPNNNNNNPTPQNTLHQMIIKPEVQVLHHHNMNIPNISSPFFIAPSSSSSSSSFLHHMMMSSNSSINTAHLSATALLEKAANVGAAAALTGQTRSVGHMASSTYPSGFSTSGHLATWQKSDRLTRDFLGLTGVGDHHHQHQCCSVRDHHHLMSFSAGAVDFPTYDRDHSSIMKPSSFGLMSDTWGEIADQAG